MFNFLNPVILFAAGAAVLLPLLIHIFNRQKVKEIFFSSLLFLRSLEKTRMRRVKIKEYLLLLIRTLIILLVVAAFARPAIRGGFATRVGAHAKTSVVILLDNSYSMGYETKDGSLFDLAKKRSKRILGQLKEGDEASLVLFASQPEPVNRQPTRDFRNLVSHLEEEARLSASGTDVGVAIKTALDILEGSKNLNREIYLITDMDKSGWAGVNPGSLPTPTNDEKLYLVAVSPPEKQNLCIEEIDFGNQLIERGKPFEITATIVNFTSQPARDLLVGLYLDGKRVSQTDVDIEEDGKATVKFTPTVEKAGIHTGFFELGDDDLLLDNRRYFTFKIPERIEVLLVGERPRDTHHLSLALNPLNAKDINKKITQMNKTALTSVDFAKYQAVVLSNLSRLTDIQLTNLESFVRKGGGAFLILGNNVDSEFYSGQLIKKLFGLNLQGALEPTASVSGFFSFENVDLDHPIFQIYRDVEKSQLPVIKFSSIFELPESGETRTLIRFNVGKPGLLERSLGAGKVLLLAASLDESQGDLVVHPFFVPMINRSVEYLASDLSRLDEDILVGSKVTRELNADLAGKGMELFTPEMKRIALQPSFQTDKLILKIDQTHLPGINDIRLSTSPSARGEVVDRFAVNIVPKDSDPERIEISEVEKRLEGFPLFYIRPQDDIEQSILQSRFGKELWKTLLWIAAGLLAVEMFLARSRKKDTVSEEKS
ncbi:MAG: VWA domain-containing protein [Candidatus Zixiibacteriota bacterium]|nr:MAG: VWA domain-containing protein [candidate division Zixibacteria bacterium]